jgi:hypothetical protein
MALINKSWHIQLCFDQADHNNIISYHLVPQIKIPKKKTNLQPLILVQKPTSGTVPENRLAPLHFILHFLS